MPSRVNDPKRHSTQTLSQPSPRLDLLPVMPCVVSSGWYAVAAYWLPRSEWWRGPCRGFQICARLRAGLFSQIHGQPMVHRSANHGARVTVEHLGEVAPAIRAPNAGEVPCPHQA